MKQEQTLKMTELDYMTASPHLQMIKAALPYIKVQEQKFFSMLVKVSELERTMKLFADKEDGAVGICSLEQDEPASPLDMLNAMKPFGTQDEQDFIDLIANFIQGSRLYQSYRDFAGAGGDFGGSQSSPADSDNPVMGAGFTGDSYAAASADDSADGSTVHAAENQGGSGGGSPWPFSIDQLKNMLPPDQQSRLETAQLLMQTFRH